MYNGFTYNSELPGPPKNPDYDAELLPKNNFISHKKKIFKSEEKDRKVICRFSVGSTVSGL